MESQMIAALVLAERRADSEGTARDPHRQRRLDALRARDRVVAANARAERWRRLRTALAHGIRRLAEMVEPPRPVCVSPAPDPC
ncbi:hypothetical protein [Microbacterium sp. MYb62]|uniref:hypothetical protein n=1 Tax=Microbacterium sp. MYb62 TaxID=1848690 RepID=UPI000CFB1030|nr:hypothetical protein [Microbacterium sp. MYb62]PRB18441.1 hypothetical protein CQ042_03905 [Microbacterium sp. MYb62]